MTFHCHGPLPHNSPLFQGRPAELQKLLSASRGRIDQYKIVYGGRQSGKTSLMLHLETMLPKSTVSCWIDFQNIPEANDQKVMAYITRNILIQITKQRSPEPVIIDEKFDFGEWLVEQNPNVPILLWMEELGALPFDSRMNLANVIRATFSKRLRAGMESLHDLCVVLVGGIEIYELYSTKVSPLANICDHIYIPDLSEANTIALVKEAWKDLEFPEAVCEEIGRGIFKKTEGHPYLTQRIGMGIECSLEPCQLPTVSLIDSVAEEVLNNDSYLDRLRRIVENFPEKETFRDLLDRKVQFKRVTRAEMAKLELLGLAKGQGKVWVPRNPLIEQGINTWLDEMKAAAPPAVSSQRQRIESMIKIDAIQIHGSTGIVIGDSSNVSLTGAGPDQDS